MSATLTYFIGLVIVGVAIGTQYGAAWGFIAIGSGFILQAVVRGFLRTIR